MVRGQLKAERCVTEYSCQANMSGPDIQRNLDPRWLFSPHNNLGELLALFNFQLRFAERQAHRNLMRK